MASADRFPWRLFFLAIAAAGGLFSYLIWVVPLAKVEEIPPAVRWAVELGAQAESSPPILALVFLFLLGPPLLYPRIARRYLFTLSLCLTLLWAGFYAVTARSAAQATGEIGRFLSGQLSSSGED